MNWTKWLSICTTRCNTWHYYINMARETHLSLNTYSITNKYPYDTYEPTWNCITRERVPPSPGDGAKFACGLDLYSKPNNVTVFSIGSNGNTMFEDGIHKRVPNAKVVTFDPTLTTTMRERVLQRKYISLKELGIGSGKPFYGQSNSFLFGLFGFKRRYETIRITTAFEKYGVPNILKIDIEGSEYGLLETITCNDVKNVDQILIEIHGMSPHIIFNWFDKCNFLLFNKEPNIWGCKGISCGEYSFISATFAYNVFRKHR